MAKVSDTFASPTEHKIPEVSLRYGVSHGVYHVEVASRVASLYTVYPQSQTRLNPAAVIF